MTEALQSYPIPNMVQGVSQQSPQQRRDTQAEAQFDCINSPINGCEARPGLDLIKLLTDKEYAGAFFHEIRRGTDEHYLVVISPGGECEAYDLKTGLAANIDLQTGAETYITTTGLPRDVLTACTLEDTTFICNREKIPLMSTTNKSAAAENAALVHWKAGGYLITYQLTIRIPTFDPDPGTISGKAYHWTYQTPDNSTAANGQYITTNRVAATFYRALTGGAAVVPTSGDDADDWEGTGPAATGETTGVTGAITATSLGFNVALNGNVIKIWRDDDVVWSIDTADGVGDTYMRAFKAADGAQAFSDLPRNAFSDFVVKIRGSEKNTDDDYYVRYHSENGKRGIWQECPKPGISVGFNDTLMPFILVNTDTNEFELKKAPWGERVSGDAENTSKDPGFIGKRIQDMFYDNNRLAIMWEGGVVWSKTNNPYVYFPSSAQTILATDPVDILVGGGRFIVQLRKAVQMDEATFLWSQKKQFRVTSGQEPFKQDTVESKPNTSFEFSEVVDPLPVAESLYFVNEPGRYATMRDLTIQEGKPRGSTEVTGHIKKYIPSGVRCISASDILGLMFLSTDGDKKNLWVYNFLIGDNDQGVITRLQSAWNIWRLPNSGDVLWHTISSNLLYVVVQRPEGVALLKADLSVDLVDAETGAEYLTRLDYRVRDDFADIVAKTYSPEDNKTIITLPWDLTECAGTYDALDPALWPVFVAQREAEGDIPRGKVWPLEQVVGNQIIVTGDCSETPLYIGYRIRAERTETTLYLRSQGQLTPVDRLQVMNYIVTYSKTGYFRIEVEEPHRTAPWTYIMGGRVFGDPANLIGAYPLDEGQHKVPVKAQNTECTITLINDSFLPSRWQTAEYQYTATLRATPGGARGRGGAAGV
jgi:hypothetical protein